MQARTIIVAVAAVLLAVGAAQATITIDTVTVGDTGNAADSTGFGAVSYTYQIGKYEVTAGQYTAFLNSVGGVDTYGLYNTNMWSNAYGCKIQRSGSSGSYSYSVAGDYANRPVNFVSFWDSCRFANWLTNNQPTGAQGAGTTETGTYLINGYNGNDGRTIQRTLNTTGKTWAVASEDEWYKAAYYKGGGTNAGYWMYPTAGNTAPGRDMNDVSGNNANIYGSPFPIDSGHYTTNAGEFQNSDSAYGTFDQGGNVWEWNEGIPYQDATYAYRGLRGGSFYNDTGDLASSLRNYYAPTSESSPFGFRVSAVPEPLTVVGMLMGLAGLARYVRRRAT